MSAAAGCATGGACAVGPRVTDAIRGMREKDGRCVGCGRKVAAVHVPAELLPPKLDLLAPTAQETMLREIVARADREVLETSDDPAVAALRATSPEGLVDAVIRLTHQIAGLLASSKPDADERARELRLQRSIVKLEIVRRAS